MAKVGHSYWDYVSWPSSLVVTNDREKREWLSQPRWSVPANRGDEIEVRCFMKTERMPAEAKLSTVTARWIKEGERVGSTSISLRATSEWIELSEKGGIDREIDYLDVALTAAGFGTVTKFDNLRVLLNDKVVLDEGFASYTPYGVGVGVAVAGAIGTKWLGWW